ncbi:MAG: hypothetical protein ACXWLH_03960 [Candidatus Saccharimonadales bacterium]
MKLKRLRLFVADNWQPTLFWTLGLIVVAGVLLFRLGTLTPGLSQPEIANHLRSGGLKQIIDNPLNAPYNLLNLGLSKLGRSGALSLRAVSAAYAFVTVLLFYYVVSRWHDKKTAIWGTLLFVTSAWFLHYARLAVPSISATLLLASLAYGHWIRKTKHSAFVGIIGIILAAWLIYIPGLVWFVVIGGIWQSKHIGEHLKDTKLSIPVIIGLGVALLTPLAVAISRQPSLLKPMAGLQSGGLPNPYDYFRHLLNVPFQIFFRGPNNPVVGLGRLPLLDVFTLTMFVLGIYTYIQRKQLDRSKILAGTLVIGSLLVALQGSLSIIVLAPVVYLIVTAGVGYFANQWLKVYPRNPLAKSIGIALVSLLVALSCIYNLRQYFVAWSQAPATKRVYQQRL